MYCLLLFHLAIIFSFVLASISIRLHLHNNFFASVNAPETYALLAIGFFGEDFQTLPKASKNNGWNHNTTHDRGELRHRSAISLMTARSTMHTDGKEQETRRSRYARSRVLGVITRKPISEGFSFFSFLLLVVVLLLFFIVKKKKLICDWAASN